MGVTGLDLSLLDRNDIIRLIEFRLTNCNCESELDPINEKCDLCKKLELTLSSNNLNLNAFVHDSLKRHVSKAKAEGMLVPWENDQDKL